jgi:hypothetical protein
MYKVIKIYIIYTYNLESYRLKKSLFHNFRSQIPIFEALSDGPNNFVGALIIAGNYNIPEVTVFFRLDFRNFNKCSKSLKYLRVKNLRI